jgi:S1-C subfamily serine protease
MVRKVDSDSNGAGLQETDVLLTLNGKLITRVSDLDIQYDNETLDAVIVRKREIMQLKVATTATSNIETSRIAVFCGALLHRPHHAVRQQISKIHSDVYISGRTRGSPAYMYGLAPTNFITHLNGVSTPDLPTFLKEAEKIPDNTYFRLKVITFDNVPWVATMKVRK